MLEKLEKLNDFLAGIPATLVGGVFLIWSFLCPKLGLSLPVDPAWVTVLISGIPLLYLAIWRTIHNKGISKISSAHLICIAMIAAILIGDLFAAGEVAFIMAAIGQATKHGVIIKSGEALEKMGNVDTIAFDKTGTLTYGKLKVSDLIPLTEEMTEDSLLTLAASAETKSEHPLGKAIVAYAKEKNCHKTLEQLRTQGKASIIVVENDTCIGMIALSDVLRPEAKIMIENLKKIHTNAVLLTEDNQMTADYFAASMGISDVHANLLPEEKVKEILFLQEHGKTVCMIGDGVNDAPALKTAQVGVAMGTMGSDIAIEAADIALMGDDLSKIPYLKRLSNATVKTIKLSITLSMVINLIAVSLSVMGVLNPTTGALVHNAGSCFVVLITALLYDRKFE